MQMISVALQTNCVRLEPSESVVPTKCGVGTENKWEELRSISIRACVVNARKEKLCVQNMIG